MKILFAMRTTDHFHYYKSVIEGLVNRGHELHLAYDHEGSPETSRVRVEEYARSHPRIRSCEYTTCRRDLLGRCLQWMRDVASYNRYFQYAELQNLKPYVEDWWSHLPKSARIAWRIPVLHTWLASKNFLAVVRMLESHLAPANAVTEHLARVQPDMVVASPTNLRQASVEPEYAKAAKRRGIPLAIQVLSWDNITTKGRFPITPDILMVWNNTQREEAIRFQDIRASIIQVTGAAAFDGWFDNLQPSENREAFCAAHRLRAADPMITYLGSSRNIARDELWLVVKLRDAFRAHSDPRLRRMQIILRPHPGNWKPYQHTKEDDIVVLPPTGALPEEDASLQLFFDTLYYSIAAVEINTTGIIDALVAGKPGIALITKEYESAQEGTIHFRQLLKADALVWVSTVTACVEKVRGLMDGIDEKCNQREQFVKDFIRPRGSATRAGDVIAAAIEALGKSHNA